MTGWDLWYALAPVLFLIGGIEVGIAFLMRAPRAVLSDDD